MAQDYRFARIGLTLALGIFLVAPASAQAPGGSLLGGGTLLQGPPAPAGASPLGGGLLQSAPPPAGGTVFTGQPPSAPAPAATEPAPSASGEPPAGGEAHAALFKETDFPSAIQCGECHPKQFREWSVSQHAYAELSPIFHAFQHSVNRGVSGSNGDFCARCHSDIAGQLGEPADASGIERHAISREGITCVTCHRVADIYNKVSGRLYVDAGDITLPVKGPTNDKELKRVLSDDTFHVQPDPNKVGRHIHADIISFPAIRTSTFCGTCHDVTLSNGFRLEEAFSEYRTSPAAAEGTTCQDCHMGKIQGKPSGYDFGPAAVVDGKPTTPRRLTNHVFAGPDYPIVHPGVFPFNKEAQELANVNEWTQFDYKAGWGTDAFEKHIPPGYKFPPHWQSVDDRYDAARIIQEQIKLRQYQTEKRLEVLRNGFGLGKVDIASASTGGVAFTVEVDNLTKGHNVPTGFTEEHPTWLEVTVTDPKGQVIFKSGDRDPNGDLRDDHSQWVRAGKVPLDDDLLNLQSRVMLRESHGGEEATVLPTPYTLTALPYVRPSTFSQIMLGRTIGSRAQKNSIEPLGHRSGSYKIAGDELSGPGTYHARLRLLSQAVPVNLVLTDESVGYDYDMSPRAVVDNLLAGAVVLGEKEFDITVK